MSFVLMLYICPKPVMRRAVIECESIPPVNVRSDNIVTLAIAKAIMRHAACSSATGRNNFKLTIHECSASDCSDAAAPPQVIL